MDLVPALRRLRDEVFVAPGRPRRPPLLDVGIALAFVGLTVVEAFTGPEFRPLLLFVAAPGLATLAVRRQFPLVVTLVVTNINWFVNPENDFTTLLSLVLVSFTIGYEVRPPRSYVGLALVVVPFTIGVTLDGLEPSDIAAAMVFFVGPWAVGVQSRMRTDRAQAAEDRASRLETERELQSALAAADERARIARELHDIVSHSISVVTIQVQAVRRRLGPEHAAEAADLAQVESTARQALAEMRRLLGVLRTDGEKPTLEPQPGLDQLGSLVERARAGGLDARLEVEGEPRPLPPGVDLAAYRIAQEGVTNALRHAHARTLTVRVCHGTDTVAVEVRDDGRGLRLNGNPGHGLVGVRERVTLYGGTVDIADSPGGGVRLQAVLPTGRPA